MTDANCRFISTFLELLVLVHHAVLTSYMNSLSADSDLQDLVVILVDKHLSGVILTRNLRVISLDYDYTTEKNLSSVRNGTNRELIKLGDSITINVQNKRNLTYSTSKNPTSSGKKVDLIVVWLTTRWSILMSSKITS